MNYESNKSLQSLNTFGIDTKAESFVEVRSVDELQNVLSKNRKTIFILGGGSNLLLTQKVKGLVIHNSIFGKKVERDFPKSIYVSAGGGENWHQFVLWCIKRGWGGIENLSLIPGRVGASPIQNIGAYGVELKDVFHKLEAVELATGDIHTFRKKDCQFGYRESIFKKKLKDKYCIIKVYFKLSKNPKLNLNYGSIKQSLEAKKIKNPTIKDVSQVVIEIRSTKLPDPIELGNSGSFFKNPEISKRQFKLVQKSYPHIVFYHLENDKIKIPAGWLIEQCGWKGRRVGNTGSHAKQALVLVNYGNATGKEILRLSIKIINSVEKKFGIKLKLEVNVL